MNKDTFLEATMELTVEAPYAFVLADANGCVVWANPAFHDLCGYELEEIVGRKPGSFLHGPDTDPDDISEFRRAIHNGDTCRVTLLNYHKTGRPYFSRIDLHPIRDDEGQLIFFGAVEFDVTYEVTSA